MCAAFDDMSFIQHQQQVRVADGAQAVGDDEAGASFQQALQRLLDKPLGARIDAGSRFVQDQDAGIGDQGGDNEENMRLGDISVIDRVLIAVNIYNKPNARFGTYDGRVIVRAGSQEVEVPLTTQEMGAWCVIAEIDNRGAQPKVTNLSHVQKNKPSLRDSYLS